MLVICIIRFACCCDLTKHLAEFSCQVHPNHAAPCCSAPKSQVTQFTPELLLEVSAVSAPGSMFSMFMILFQQKSAKHTYQNTVSSCAVVFTKSQYPSAHLALRCACCVSRVLQDLSNLPTAFFTSRKALQEKGQPVCNGLQPTSERLCKNNLRVVVEKGDQNIHVQQTETQNESRSSACALHAPGGSAEVGSVAFVSASTSILSNNLISK